MSEKHFGSVKSDSIIEHGQSPISLEMLRSKLDAAIVAERWDAVAAIRARIVEVERADVIDLERERKRRGSS